ncbi:hypothetical protein LTR16_011325, partial [Cryomyces antarcticus]
FEGNGSHYTTISHPFSQPPPETFYLDNSVDLNAFPLLINKVNTIPMPVKNTPERAFAMASLVFTT